MDMDASATPRPSRKVPVAGPPTSRKAPGRKIPSRNRYYGPDGGTLTDAHVEFGAAIDRYKREKKRPFPLYSEILDVLMALGYRKVAAESN